MKTPFAKTFQITRGSWDKKDLWAGTRQRWLSAGVIKSTEPLLFQTFGILAQDGKLITS
jgi:hypothetical protein